jgi:hypothetical protein
MVKTSLLTYTLHYIMNLLQLEGIKMELKRGRHEENKI